jgi:DNA-binding NarL/FixJ family response regulator
MLQPPEVLVKAIKKVYAGEIWIEHSMVARLLTTTDIASRSLAVNYEADCIQQLSNREREVIQLISLGLRNQQIANQLCISTSTVGHHLTSIYSKLGVSDRLELLVFAHQKGLGKKLK